MPGTDSSTGRVLRRIGPKQTPTGAPLPKVGNQIPRLMIRSPSGGFLSIDQQSPSHLFRCRPSVVGLQPGLGAELGVLTFGFPFVGVVIACSSWSASYNQYDPVIRRPEEGFRPTAPAEEPSAAPAEPLSR